MPKRKPDVEEADMNGEAVGVTPNRRRRIHLTLNEDESSIDWSSTSERDKQRFSSLVSNDADALEMIGLAAGQAETTPITVDRDSIPLIYDTIAMVIKTSGRLFLKWPPQLCAFMNYTEEQKEKLKEPTAKVIEKRAPAWVVKNQDVLALLMAFSAITKEMMTNAIVQWQISVRSQSAVVDRGPEVEPTNGVGQATPAQ